MLWWQLTRRIFVKRRRMETFLLIGIGGFIGANLRYLISAAAAERFGTAFPWGTLVINFSGSCLLALFLALAANRINLDPRFRLLIATGFFGAYTTFSTYAFESITLLRAGDWIGTAGNILGTNLICLGGALLGLLVGSRL
jgi:CrcB protein